MDAGYHRPQKAVAAATKNVSRVSIVDGTIPHEAIGVRGASRVMLKPASMLLL